MHEVCSKCLGQKTYRGIGCIISKCSDCNGKGQVEINLDTKDDEIIKEEKPKRKLKERKQGDKDAAI